MYDFCSDLLGHDTVDEKEGKEGGGGGDELHDCDKDGDNGCGGC